MRWLSALVAFFEKPRASGLFSTKREPTVVLEAVYCKRCGKIMFKSSFNDDGTTTRAPDACQCPLDERGRMLSRIAGEGLHNTISAWR